MRKSCTVEAPAQLLPFLFGQWADLKKKQIRTWWKHQAVTVNGRPVSQFGHPALLQARKRGMPSRLSASWRAAKEEHSSSSRSRQAGVTRFACSSLTRAVQSSAMKSTAPKTNPAHRLGPHACGLKFLHPETQQEMSFESPLPKDLVRLI